MADLPDNGNQPDQEEDVDQFFDGGGETFLAADHASGLFKFFLSCN